MGYDYVRLGEAIRDARGELKLTQAELAAAAGVGLSTIKNLESGRTSIRWPRSIPPVEAALHWPAGRARAIATGRFDPAGVVVPLVSQSAAIEVDMPDDEFIRGLREERLDPELLDALITSYRKRKARQDAELQEEYRKIIRARGE